MGLNVYANRRAAAYLSDEYRGWDLFLQWRLLNPVGFAQLCAVAAQ